jgi:hypothetical protein
VVQDDTGGVVFNAFQQDMTVLRAVFRIAFQVATPVTEREAGETGTPYPFSVLSAAA